MGLSEQLFLLRQQKGLSQEQLAVKLQMQQSAISKYERGENVPSIEALIEMAKIFECSMDYLLGLSSIRNPYTSEHFTPQEAEVIFRYRKLNHDNRVRLDERLSAMLDGQRRTPGGEKE